MHHHIETTSTEQCVDIPHEALQHVLRSLYRSKNRFGGSDPSILFQEFLERAEMNGSISMSQGLLEECVAALNDQPNVKRPATTDDLLQMINAAIQEYQKEKAVFTQEASNIMAIIDEQIGIHVSEVRSCVFRKIWDHTDESDASQPGEEEILLAAMRKKMNHQLIKRIMRRAHFNPDEQRRDLPYTIVMKMSDILEEQTLSVTGGDHTEELRKWADDLGLLESVLKPLQEFFPPDEPLDQNRMDKEAKAPYVHQALRNVLSMPSLKSMDKDSVEELLKTVIHLVMNPNHKARITVGFGGSHDELNARLPAYTVAAAQLMEGLMSVADQMKEKIQQDMALPELLLISAHGAAQVYNGMDPGITHQRATDNLNLAVAYLKEFHPRVAEKTTTSFDDKRLYSHHHFLEQVNALNDEEIPTKLRESLGKMAEHHSMNGEITREEAWRRSKHYAAAHPAIFRDMAPHDASYHEVMYGDLSIPDTSITIGGPPERVFNTYRRLLQKRIQETRSEIGRVIPLVMLICAEGETPVYYAGEEPSLRELFETEGQAGRKYSKVFYHDWKRIMEDIARSSGELPSDKAELKAALETAEKRYMIFLKRFWEQSPSLHSSTTTS